MRARYRFFLWGAIVFVLLGVVIGTVKAQDDVAAQVLRRINRARAEANLPPLERNAQLDAAAQGQANDILQHGSGLGHRGSDGSSVIQRITRAGYNGEYYGENWAGYRTLDKTFEFWLSDPPHRKNILNPNYREIGIGVAARTNGGFIVVTDFGGHQKNLEFKPSSAAAQQQAKPTPPRPKPTAKPISKPTQIPPTRKPTRKPTSVPVAVSPQSPPATQIASAPQAPKSLSKPLRAGGKIQRLILLGETRAEIGVTEMRGDATRMFVGGTLAIAGALCLGVAIVAHRRRSRRVYS